MWGVGALLAGTALWVGSVGLWLAFAFFVSLINLFVPLYEERDLERRFGEEYRDYCWRAPRPAGGRAWNRSGSVEGHSEPDPAKRDHGPQTSGNIGRGICCRDMVSQQVFHGH